MDSQSLYLTCAKRRVVWVPRMRFARDKNREDDSTETARNDDDNLLRQGQYWLFDPATALLSCVIVGVVTGVIAVVGVIVSDVVVSVLVTDIVVGVIIRVYYTPVLDIGSSIKSCPIKLKTKCKKK